MIPPDVAVAQESIADAVRDVIDIITALQDASMGTDGYTFGSKHMSREDRILMYLDDLHSGALDNLKLVNPTYYAQYQRQYNRDLAASPQMQIGA